MIWQLDLLLFAILVATAVMALQVRQLLGAVIVLGAYSLFAALLFAGMGAVDVAFVEAVLGVGVTGLLLLATIMRTSHLSPQTESAPLRWPVVVILSAFVALMLYASTGLPDRGDPAAPAHQHVAPDYIERSLAETNTPNVVTALLADFRSHDTLGETLVIFTAGLACAARAAATGRGGAL
jgi:multicomponent Na+:H+ antiporter subunit B